MDELKLYILGGGGYGRIILDALIDNHISVTGFIDPLMDAGSSVSNIIVSGDDNFLATQNSNNVLLVNGVGSQPKGSRRKDLFNKWKDYGFSFKGVAHKNAIISPSTSFLEGVQVMAGALIQSNVNILENTIIYAMASVDHDCSIGRNVFVGPGAILCGGVIVHDEAYISAGAIILPGLVIGSKAIIGAGAVVTKNVDSCAVVYGARSTVKC